MKSYKKWSRAEKQFVLDHCEQLSDSAIASRMSELSGENITKEMVRQQRRQLKASKKNGRPAKKIISG